MLISTNKVQPKVNHRFDKHLEEEKDEKGEPTGNIISSIPKDVLTTSQERVKNRPTRTLPHNFPGVHIVQQKPGDRGEAKEKMRNGAQHRVLAPPKFLRMLPADKLAEIKREDSTPMF